MFKMHPLWGVGLGQYKWHYLEAQREMFKRYPENPWQYTHWAHNEFLQWFCEGGLVGGLLLTAMWGLWGYFFLAMLWRKPKKRVALEVVWACSLIALISFNALWTRPFHRIENTLWLSLAFALSNRSIVELLTPQRAFRLNEAARGLGIVLLAVSLGGLYYLGDGMIGDRTLRNALAAQTASEQRSLLEKASQSLMVRSEAQKFLGYHYLQLGEQALKAQAAKEGFEMLEKGYQMLWRHFESEPHTDELRSLIDWAQSFQLVDNLKTLASFLKPGTYRLGLQTDARDSEGNLVSAVVLIPLRESGGMRIAEGLSDEEFASYDQD
jgi:hypothetical protein